MLTLFVRAAMDWLGREDWERWWASALGLAVDHPTAGPDYQPIAGGVRQPTEGSASAA